MSTSVEGGRHGRRQVPLRGAPRQPAGGEVPYLGVGRIVAPWGIKGEVKVQILTDFPQRLACLERVFVGGGRHPYGLQRARLHRGCALLKLAGCDSVEAAAALRGQMVYIARQDAAPLAEGHYYWHQVIGLEVWSAGGEFLGWVKEILVTGSNDVYVVKGPRGEVLVPAIEEVVKALDPSAGRITVELLEGMI